MTKLYRYSDICHTLDGPLETIDLAFSEEALDPGFDFDGADLHLDAFESYPCSECRESTPAKDLAKCYDSNTEVICRRCGLEIGYDDEDYAR